MFRFTIAVASVWVAFFSDCSPAPEGNAEQIEHGREVYLTQECQLCHGYIGQGTVAPKLAPDPIPLDIFTQQLRNPRERMPVYTATILSDSDLLDLYAYLLSIPRPQPWQEIPPLRDVSDE